MRVATIVGARPQFVKAAMLSQALRVEEIQEVLIHTGQHYDDEMSKVFFDELEIPAPRINLAVGSGSHGAQTGRMLEGIEAALEKNSPDVVVVYGDTNSTLAGALAATKLHIPVAHIEAGLRSFERRMPEEINRLLTDHASDLLFAPTAAAVENLRREGIAAAKIHLAGDVMYDAALRYGAKAERESTILECLGLRRREFFLVTIHRAENTDDGGRLAAICQALIDLAREMPVVAPIHPRTREALWRGRWLDRLERSVRVIPPAGYLDMVMLERHARLIVTDSGGVQKEAFFYRVPCVTVREQTEWIELVTLGWNRLAPPVDASRVVAVVRDALASTPRTCDSPYGDGHAGERIASIIRASHKSYEGTAFASAAK
ncbi:MAG TPA: UDP-N-acetylglucosamine 2-epimerase (non-hydrolyzing) [Candidatus Aquilonibacter sp.]|nr:UDP-N-acetylglucosamine 2-epimerase (non-hydrolyzing) [Candidatus Aquilonibacter sp.]